jgi:hypothetical protein
MSPTKLLPFAFAAALSVSVFAQQQPAQPNAADKDKDKPAQNQSQSGEAMVVTRDGPSIALSNGAQPIIAVAFPSQQGQGQPQQPGQAQQAQGDQGTEVSIFVANPNESAKPKEVLFESRNAANGMVVYNGNELGGAQTASAQQQPGQPAQPNAKEKQTQLIFSAKVNGRMAKVTELVSQGNARILVVKHEDQAQAKAGQPGQPAQPGQPQPAAAQQPGQKEKEKAQAEQNEAVIFVYLRGEQTK